MHLCFIPQMREAGSSQPSQFRLKHKTMRALALQSCPDEPQHRRNARFFVLRPASAILCFPCSSFFCKLNAAHLET